MNYLSPNVKRGDFSEEEQDFVVRLHNILGNRFFLRPILISINTIYTILVYYIYNTLHHLSKKKIVVHSISVLKAMSKIFLIDSILN